MRGSALLGLGIILLLGPPASAAQEGTPEDVREARIWLDRGEEPLVQRGDRLRVYYRTSHDSYVAVFHIDTDGSVRLVHPTAPDEDHYTVGGRDYRLLFPRSPYWIVDEDPGVGYYFLISSPEPFHFSDFDYARYERGWDLSRVGRTVYQDPYLAMDDYVAALIPDWEYVPYALDFISYDVGTTHEYPRFMCYECHGFRSYAQWNPYAYACTDFRVVIWDDPYYYPAYRYSGTRVVYATPLRARPRYGFTTRVVGQPWAPVIRRREAPPVRTAQFKEPQAARASGVVPPLRRAAPTDALRPQGTNRPARASVPGLSQAQRRSSANVAPGGTSTGGAVGSSAQGRPVLQRRPSETTGSGTLQAPPRTGVKVPTTGSRSSPTTGSRPTVVRPPTARGATQGSVRPSTGRTAAPTVTRAPSTTTVRPPVRPNTTQSRPSTTQSRPNTTQSRPAVRSPSRPPTTQARPTVRPPTTGTRPTVRPRSGSSSGGSARPPVRRRGGGGGD